MTQPDPTRWGEGLPTGPAKPTPRWLKVAWPIWSGLWALFWITVGWAIAPGFNVLFFAVSIAAAAAFGNFGRPLRR
jgi:hypothetical protein